MRQCAVAPTSASDSNACAATLTRPAIANERLKRTRAGQIVLQLKSPWRDGTIHIVMSPLQLMQRLAALVPRPRLHLIRFHGARQVTGPDRCERAPQPLTDLRSPHAGGAS